MNSVQYFLTLYSSMKILTPLLLLVTIFGCKNSKDFKSNFEKHKFDATIINNLPLYERLRQTVLNSYDSFYLSDTKYDFTYIYNFDTSTQISGYSNICKLPQKQYVLKVDKSLILKT